MTKYGIRVKAIILLLFIGLCAHNAFAQASQQTTNPRNEVFDRYLKENKGALGKLKSDVALLAQQDVARFSSLLSRHGIDKTYAYLEKFFEKRGNFGFRNTRNNTIYFTAVVPLFSDKPLPLLYYEYSYNTKTRTARVTCYLPDYNIKEHSVFANVTPAPTSKPILSGYRKRLMVPGDIKTALEYAFGMEIATHKEKIKGSSGYKIIKVDQSGIFDFNGVKPNDLLVGIGNQSLRDVKNLDELGAIINAVPVGSVTQFSIIRNGEKKIIPFKMYDPRECVTE